MSWDNTLKSTDIKYIHEDIFTNKNKNKVNSKQTPSVQMAQAERQNTKFQLWTTVQSQVREGREQNKDNDAQIWFLH